MRRELPVELGVAVVLAVVIAFFSICAPDFRTVDNWGLLAKQLAELAVISSGMTLVIATGGIDISVGSVLAFCAMTLGWLVVHAHWRLEAAIVAAIVTGAAWGLLNGLLIAVTKLQPIIVTLATFAAARAGATMFNAGGSISDIRLTLLNRTFDNTDFLHLPLLLWVSLAALFASGATLQWSRFGRELLALGGNRTAARLSGMRTLKTETLVYVLNGALAGFAAVLNTAYNSTATPDAGQFREMTAITAVVLGGTVITGGQATMVGTGLGVLTICALLSGVRLMGQEDQMAWLLVGAALLLAVVVQKLRRRQ
jgi:ribose/xylose/arabinose/galactoside ABC-type transport system permease subunit